MPPLSQLSTFAASPAPPPPVAVATTQAEGLPKSSSPGLSRYNRESRNPQLKSLGFRRVEIYHLQSIARSILPSSGVSYCLRSIVNGKDLSVQVQVKGTFGKAWYGNLFRCGLVWPCPVCAARISEQRRQEVQRGVTRWAERGGSMVHLILTVPHYREQSLKEVLTKFSKARRLMLNRKPFKRLARRIGLVGSIRGLEVTYGDNGWHVHSHEGLFLPGTFYSHDPWSEWADPEAELQDHYNQLEIKVELLEMWGKACLTAGLGFINDHGVELQDGRKAANYLTKWGLDCELTKSHLKRGRGEHFSPFDLLRAIRDEHPQSERLRAAFHEFAIGFNGRRQLTWSDGMLKLLGLDEVEDSAIAGEPDEDWAWLVELTRAEWFAVYHSENRGELIEAGRIGGEAGVLRHIAKLTGRI